MVTIRKLGNSAYVPVIKKGSKISKWYDCIMAGDSKRYFLFSFVTKSNYEWKV